MTLLHVRQHATLNNQLIKSLNNQHRAMKSWNQSINMKSETSTSLDDNDLRHNQTITITIFITIHTVYNQHPQSNEPVLNLNHKTLTKTQKRTKTITMGCVISLTSLRARWIFCHSHRRQDLQDSRNRDHIDVVGVIVVELVVGGRFDAV